MPAAWPDDRVPVWRPVTLTGDSLGCLIGATEERVAIRACHRRCEPIPWQLDERHPGGDLLFTHGALAVPPDTSIIDSHDELTWMLADAGRRMRPEEARPDALCRLEVRTATEGGFEGWMYAEVLPEAAPRAAQSYVQYDAAADTVVAARAALGFRGPTPRYLGLELGESGELVNILDRLKIRASARFLGLIPMRRDDDDFETPEVSWRAGPVRVIHRQRQRIRLGFGIRSPKFVVDATVYRDFAELPVLFHLNFPPTYFFGAIRVSAVLDFRDLRGWQFLAPGLPSPLIVGSAPPELVERVNRTPGDWFALVGPKLQIVQVLATSPSLAAVRTQVLYREEISPGGPEDHPGEMPGVGFQLTDWRGVGSGFHSFSALSYVLPADYEIERFLRERTESLAVETTR
jgi:hypothetical protein